MEHESERAASYDEALRLIQEYRLFAAPPRFSVGAHNWDRDPRVSGGWLFDAQSRLGMFRRTVEGRTEIEIDNRYLLFEPFDMEVNDHGFVVWEAAEFFVSLCNQIFHPSPEFERRQSAARGHLVPIDDESRTETVFMPYTPPEHSTLVAMEGGAPITGLLDFDQFPITASGWRPNGTGTLSR